MRTAITVGWFHGAKETKTLLGPETAIEDQIAAFKKLPATEVHDQFERVELWESGSGVTKTRKFISKDEQKRREQVRLEQEKAAKKAADAKAKADATAKAQTPEKAAKKAAKKSEPAKAETGTASQTLPVQSTESQPQS